MSDILDKIMNFINDNTMLLIIICIFLIVILIIYLIDNTIKTKRLEQEEMNKQENPEPVVLQNEIPEKEVTPVVEAPVVEEPKVETPIVEPEVAPVVEPVVTPVVEEPKVEEVPVTPVIDSNIDELLNKDYSANNEVVNNIPNEPLPEVKEQPVVQNKYNNDKKLSDIFGKKEEPATKKIETTQDFSDELDRILQKLNSEESKIDEETNDYTNMF